MTMVAVKTEKDSGSTVNLDEAIEKYPGLYDFQIPENAGKDIIEKAWSKVVEEVEETRNIIT